MRNECITTQDGAEYATEAPQLEVQLVIFAASDPTVGINPMALKPGLAQ